MLTVNIKENSGNKNPSSHFLPELLSFCTFPLNLRTQPCMSLEKATAPRSSALAWKIPWTEEPGGLQSMGSLRVGHDSVTSLSLFTFMHWRRKWNPTPVFLPGESKDGRAWWAAVYGVTQSWTQLKWLSSSSVQLIRALGSVHQTLWGIQIT